MLMFRQLFEDALTRAYLTSEGVIQIEHFGSLLSFASPAELLCLVHVIKADQSPGRGVYLTGWGEPLRLCPEQISGFLRSCVAIAEEAHWWQGTLQFREQDTAHPKSNLP